MAKILMITSRNIVDENGNATGVGAATLIYRRASALFKTFGTRTFIIPLNGQVKHTLTGHEGCEFVLNTEGTIKESITSFIREQRPEVIIFSGEKSYFYHNRIFEICNKEGIESKLIIDLHGALEEGIEYETGILLYISYIRYYFKRRIFKMISSNTDGFLVVSDELMNHYSTLIQKEYSDVNYYKVRCGINEVISNELRLKWRKEIRMKLGIKNDAIVFVYSGYRAKWQCIDEIIENYKTIDRLRENVFFLMLTKTDEFFDQLLKESFPKANYYAGLIPHNQIFEYLSACDVGMLIRDDNFTNQVAFPNKFSDYINSGLSLVISPSLREPTRLLEKYNIPHIKLSPQDNISIDDLFIVDSRNKDINHYYDLCNRLCTYELLYASQIKSQFKQFEVLIGAKE